MYNVCVVRSSSLCVPQTPRDNKAPRVVRGEGTHDNKAPWRKEFKIVQQTPRGERWKLLFGYANCRRL